MDCVRKNKSCSRLQTLANKIGDQKGQKKNESVFPLCHSGGKTLNTASIMNTIQFIFCIGQPKQRKQ